MGSTITMEKENNKSEKKETYMSLDVVNERQELPMVHQ
jgi:hypothetical protein